MRRIFKDKRTLARCHIYQMLSAQKRKHISFHTPGHKQKGFDITELSYSDNLACPHGCIAKAEQDIANILGANKSFILTDGSTSGVFSMLQASKTLGARKIYVIEPAHVSVYNACAVLGLTPLSTANGADAVLCTSPDYYGNIADFKALRALCENGKKLLLIDGAHGGHLHFDKDLYAGAHADFWVDGVHKSLPALTQGAVVSARTQAQAVALEKAVKLFRTTSPAYPIMASVEYAVKYPQNERLDARVKEYALKQKRVRLSGDWTKLCATFGKNAFTVEKELEAKGVYSEFCDGEVICFYLSPATKNGEFSRLCRLLDKAFEKYPLELETSDENNDENSVERNPAPLVLSETDGEWVALSESENRVCLASCGLFPPCVPLIKAGETITKEKIERLQKANNVFGLSDGKIYVCREDKQ